MKLVADGALSARFITFADRECREYSPLYERLSRGVAADPDLLRLAAHARPGQPTPNLLFGAVHLLLLAQPVYPLASYYAGITSGTERGDPFPLFRAFCSEHEAAIRILLQTRLVQTNEVRRSACLLLAFATVAERSGGRSWP